MDVDAQGVVGSMHARCTSRWTPPKGWKDRSTRRRWLHGVVTLPLLGVEGTVDARQGLEERSDGSTSVSDRGYGPTFVKQENGLLVQDLTQGRGEGARVGDRVVFDYVCRRSNGYFVYGTVEGVGFQPLDVETEPESAILGNGELILGLEQGLLGLRPGAKRRLVVPPSLGFVREGLRPRPPSYGARRQISVHAKEPFLFEVYVLDVKRGL